ncbi:hypothetical protein B0T17DRAFT_518340 [Bombardia bombarda]|uniref:Uncharacterized protein n=1 Tax=Bombardia bombarda TaxID=252184 RepID=A0AA39XLL4_9PEZI|nr:hypothetical protein B0T17DRAFT_518340 [Bombardia bombarda]
MYEHVSIIPIPSIAPPALYPLTEQERNCNKIKTEVEKSHNSNTIQPPLETRTIQPLEIPALHVVEDEHVQQLDVGHGAQLGADPGVVGPAQDLLHVGVVLVVVVDDLDDGAEGHGGGAAAVLDEDVGRFELVVAVACPVAKAGSLSSVSAIIIIISTIGGSVSEEAEGSGVVFPCLGVSGICWVGGGRVGVEVGAEDGSDVGDFLGVAEAVGGQNGVSL